MKNSCETSKLPMVTALFVVLGGCATPGDFAEQAIKANVALERSTNQMLLLNIVRAHKRYPMHFTGIQTINGPIGSGVPSWKIPLPFGPDFKMQTYSPELSYKPDTPSFQVAMLDTQEFMRGITTPIPPKTFGYYLEQGWPRELLMHLLVREIEVFQTTMVTDPATNKPVRKTKRLAQYINIPQNADEMADFQRAVSELSQCEISIDSVDADTNFGPPLTEAGASNPLALAEMKKAELLLLEVDKKPSPIAYQAVARRQVPILRIPQESPCSITVEKPTSLVEELVEKSPLKIALSAFHFGFGKPDYRTAIGKQEFVALTLRSPEAVAYYIGELTRAQLEERWDRNGKRVEKGKYTIRSGALRGNRTESLFEVRENDAAENVAVAVEFEGASFSIPKNGGRSMHALSLLNQLVNLQKKATDLPGTTTIRVTQ